MENESTESFFESLLNDTESYLRREQFISDMEQNLQWDENGVGMEFDISDIDFSDNESFEAFVNFNSVGMGDNESNSVCLKAMTVLANRNR